MKLKTSGKASEFDTDNVRKATLPKFLKFFLSAVLIFSLINTSAFAEGENQEANESIAENPQNIEQALKDAGISEDVIDEAMSNQSSQGELSSGSETIPPMPLPELEQSNEVTVSLDLENAYLLVGNETDGEKQKCIGKHLVVAADKDFEFETAADTLFAFDETDPLKGVSAKNFLTDEEVPVELKEGTYTIRANYISENLEIKVEAILAPKEQPEENAEAPPFSATPIEGESNTPPDAVQDSVLDSTLDLPEVEEEPLTSNVSIEELLPFGAGVLSVTWEESDFVVEGNEITDFSASGKEKFDSLMVGLKSLEIPSIPGVNKITADFSGLGINALSIAEGYTEIGEGVFRDNQIRTFTAPDTLTVIGNLAFSGNRLTTISLPNVATIGARAFAINALTEVELPASLLEIGEGAFNSNGRVVAVKTDATDIESSFRAGDGYVVNPVTMVIMAMDSEGKPIASDTVIGADYSTSNLYPAGKPAQVKAPSISGYSVIDESGDIQQIDAAIQGLVITFVYESSMASVTIEAYDKVFATGSIVNEAALLEGVRATSNYDGSDVTSITVTPSVIDTSAEHETLVTYKAIDAYGNVGTKTVSVKIVLSPEEAYIDGFWKYSDFIYGGTGLRGFSASGEEKYSDPSGDGKYLAIPDHNPYENVPVTDIDMNSFRNLEFTSIDLSTNPGLRHISQQSFYLSDLSSLNLSGSTALETIGSSAFFSSSKLTTLDFSNCTSLQKIGDRAFYSCSSLISIDFSNCVSLRLIDAYAFNSCRSLTSLDFSDCGSLQRIAYNAFFNCENLASVDFSNCSSLTGIDNYAFNNCINLTTLIFNGCSSLDYIGYGSFYQCLKLSTIDLSECSSLKHIKSSAFTSCENLTTLDLSGCSSLESIGGSAFQNCLILTTIDLSGCSSLKKIEGAAFYNCKSLTTLNLSKSSTLEVIEKEAFFYCESLTSLDFSGCSSLREISYQAFFRCTIVTSLNFTDCSSLQTIGQNAFYNCFELPSLSFSGCSSLNEIGSGAFFLCVVLTSLDLSSCSSLTTIGNSAFSACIALPAVDFSKCNSLQTIGAGAFNLCLSIKSLDFSNLTSLQTIGANAFSFCSLLERINFTGCSSLYMIGNSAFSSSSKLAAFDFSGCSSLRVIGEKAFAECKSMTELDLSETTSFVLIGQEAFKESPLEFILIGSISNLNTTSNLYRSLSNVSEDAVITRHNKFLPVFVRENLQKVENAPGYILNPVRIVITHVDKDTNEVLRSNRVITASAPLVDYQVEAPAVFGHKVFGASSQKVSIGTAMGIQTIPLTFTYEKDPQNLSDIRLYQEDETNYSTVGKNGYVHIGDEVFNTRVDIRMDGTVDETLVDKELYVYYDPDRVSPKGMPNLNDIGVYEIVEPGIIKITLTSTVTSGTIGIRFYWTLVQGATELYEKQNIDVELVDAKTYGVNTIIAEGNTVSAAGYYNTPAFKKEAIGRYDGTVEGGRYTITPSIAYIFRAQYFERNIDSITFIDTIPTYTAFAADGTTEQRFAVLSEESKMYGWKEHGDGTVSFTRENIKVLGDQVESVFFEFPDIQPYTWVENVGRYEAQIKSPNANESVFAGSGRTSTYFDAINEFPFSKSTELYINDTDTAKAEEFSWSISFGSKSYGEKNNISSLSNIVIRDFNLDSRMEYTRVSPGLVGEITVRAYDEFDAVIWARTSSSDISVPEGVRDNIEYITIEVSNALSGTKTHYLTVYTEFRDPASVVYDEANASNNTFFNTAGIDSLTAYRTDGTETYASGSRSARKILAPFAVGILKSLSEDSPDFPTYGDTVIYDIALQKYINKMLANASDFPITLENVLLYDVLPVSLSSVEFTPSSNFIQASEGFSYRIIAGAYNKDGVAHDVIEIKANKIRMGELTKKVGSVSGTVSTAFHGSDLSNTVYLDFSNVGDVSLHGQKTSDNPIDSSREILFSTAKESVQAHNQLYSTKFVRVQESKTPEVWGAWSTGGVKLGGNKTFQYRLNAQNATGDTYTNFSFYDIFPYEGDTLIKDGSTSRNSAYANIPLSLTVPDGYTAYYTIENVIDVDGLEAATWVLYSEGSDISNATAIKVEANSGTELAPSNSMDVVVTMQTPTDVSKMLGQRAYNTFIDSITSHGYIETAPVFTELSLPTRIVVNKVNSYNRLLPGAEFYLYDSTGELVAKGVTNESGMLVFNNIEQGNYTLEEVKAPDGYEQLEDTISISTADFEMHDTYIEAFVKVKNTYAQTKQDIIIKKIDAQGNPLAGATFEVTSLDEKIKQTLTTSETGIVTFFDLPSGTYNVEELEAPSGFQVISGRITASVGPWGVMLNSIPIEAFGKITSSGNMITVINDVAAVDVYKLGMGFNNKIDKEETSLLPSDGVGLSGVKLDLYNAENSSLIDTYTTGENGHVRIEKLSTGTRYFLREQAAPAGYDIAKDTYFYVSEKGELLDDEGGTPYVSQAVIVKDLPRKSINIYKLGIVSESKASLPETELTLNDGFRLENAALEIYMAQPGSDSQEYDNTWEKVGDTLITDSKGHASIALSADVLYYLKEVSAPEGYKLDPDYGVYFRVTKEGSLVDKNGADFFSKSVIVKNLPEEVSVDLIVEKTDGDGTNHLQDAEFLLEKKTGENVDAEGNYLGDVYEDVASFVSDEFGFATYTGLNSGTYRLSEIKAPKGYLASTRTEIFVVTSTSKDITFTGSNAFRNAAIEPIMVKGEYVGTFNLENETDKANYESAVAFIEAEGKVAHAMYQTKSQVVLLSGLGGATFSMDVYDDGVDYKTGTSSESHSLVSKNDGTFDLPSGFVFDENKTYVFVETTAPAGYVLDATPYVYQPKKEQDSIELLGGKWIALKNAKETHRIVVSKYDTSTNKPLGGAGFTLYYEDRLTPVVGDSSGGQVEQITDRYGYAEFSGLYPGVYYLKESTVPEGYEAPEGWYQIIVTDSVGTEIIPVETNDVIVDSFTGTGNVIIRAYNDLFGASKLVVKKEVVGGVDPNEAFDFLVTVDDGTGAQTRFVGAYRLYENDADLVGSAGYTGSGIVSLTQGQRIELQGVAKGTKYVVTENNKKPNFPYVVSNSTGGEEIAEGTMINGKNEVVFTNTYLEIAPTITKTSNRHNADGVGEVLYPEDIVTYELVVKNDSPLDMTGVWVRDYIPVHTTFSGFVGSEHHATYKENAGASYVDWYIESLKAGETVTLKFSVEIAVSAINTTVSNQGFVELVGDEHDVQNPNTPSTGSNVVTNEVKKHEEEPPPPIDPPIDPPVDPPVNPPVVPPVDPPVVPPVVPPVDPPVVPSVDPPVAPPTSTPVISIPPSVILTPEELTQEVGGVIDQIMDALIFDEETPEGLLGVDCWVHWYILLGIIVASVYSAGVIARRRHYIEQLDGYEYEALSDELKKRGFIARHKEGIYDSFVEQR